MWRPRSPPRLKFLAATVTADTAVMSYSQRPHRGGRNQWRRGFSDRSNGGGRGLQVTEDSQSDSVRENFSNQRSFQPQQFDYNPRPPSPYNQNQQSFHQPPPPYNRYQPPRQPFHLNHAAKPFRPRNSKPWDYREWEYAIAKTQPPPRSDRFIVLSYNILADYLASTHRNLYFHIPYHMMNWEWRMRNIMFELGLWSADILCLQEVDRFHDLEEQLKPMGYSGIWKMRTGRAIDGCAIFWRTSRFKLLHEEYMEFNKYELRENVAQICVLEFLNQSFPENKAAPLKSSSNSNKVVICNYHALYNPRRGEIKLGQIRRLLEGAHAVSKSWDDAPVVLCGDFNCTPKSPLYNFISEQKLDLSGVDRDKVSGQASAEIPLPTYNPNSGAQSCDIPARVPQTVDKKGIGIELEEKMDNLSIGELNKTMVENEDVVEDDNVFVDALYGNQDAYPTTSGKPITSDLDDSSKESLSFRDSQFLLPSDEVLDDLSPSLGSEVAGFEQTSYDPSAWNPKEIATATGNEDCKFLEHPLQLKSTYTEVKDFPGTRDSYGEPLVTSYNRRFLGTVDYIWRSEGLQTVRVLAPFPKEAMRWTPGFPTKRWGSDHIALASELAFTKNWTNQDPKS